MKVALVFLALVALAAAAVMPKFEKRAADKEFLTKQKALLELVWRVNQPLINPELLQIAKEYRIEDNFDKYTKVEAIKNFLNHYKYGFLPQNEIFTIFNEDLKNEVVYIFDLFYYAKDWDTFYRTAAWARVHINPGQFVYALTVAVLHREDTRGLVLPPPYEIYPQLFVENDVVQRAYEVRMQRPYTDLQQEFVIPVNKTFYPYFMYEDESEKQTYNKFYKYEYGMKENYYLHEENRVSYFTEDVALNTFYNYLHLDNPFWMNATYGYKSEHRGEMFYYYNQQILARYYLERYSNDLLDIDAFSFEKPIEYGYNPDLRYPNGQFFPTRPDNYKFEQYDTYEYTLNQDFYRRIVDAIDLGYVFTEKGEKVSISEERGIDILGQLMQSTVDSVNPRYYGKLYRLALNLLGRVADTKFQHRMAPGVLQHYETLLRDPVYYRFLKTVTYIFYRYKSYLPSYNREQYTFPGVKVDSVDVDKLVTYFDNFDVDISSVTPISKVEEDVVIKARQFRLNHKPFTYKVNVVSDKASDVMVRVFIGPKYDTEGRVIDINDKRKLMVEIDRFPYQVTVGQNNIVRNSRDFATTVEDQTTVRDLYKNVVDALQGKTQYYYEDFERYCAYPDRLLLPKGKRGGMPFTFFVAVTPLTEKTYDSKFDYPVGCGAGLGLLYQDKYPLGFPFDRYIEETQFYVPNFYEKDVMIFHKRAEDNANISH